MNGNKIDAKANKKFLGLPLIIRAALYFIIVIGAIVMVFPFYWMLLTSFKILGEMYTWPPSWIPHQFYYQNYIEVWNCVPLLRYSFNSALVTGVIILGSLYFSSSAGFAFAKYDFPGKNIIFVIFLSTLMIPDQVIIIPVFLILRFLGLVNTYFALIVPWLISVFGVFLFRLFVEGLPTELIEAARVDGYSEIRIYLEIVLPLCKPVLATLTIFLFMWHWNSLFWPLIVTNSEEMRTLQVGIASLRGEFHIHWPMLMAGATISIIPVIIVFIIFQKYLVGGIALTGLKGV